MKPEVLIRADGGPQIGLGHLVRCSALAHMLKEEFSVSFFCREIPESLQDEFRQNGFPVNIIEKEEQFFEKINQESIVVLDGYGFDTDYQRAIKGTGAKLVCIDDLHDKEFMADLIINHAPGITPGAYKAQPYTLFALGPEYALLRPAFLEQAKKERIIETIETLLISFGGADPKRLTEKTLKVVLEFSVFKKIIVVTGAAFELYDDFTQLLASDQRIELKRSLNEQQMLEAMLESDLAILPASGVLFEALSSGCHVISGYYTNNQKDIYLGFKNANFIFDGGSFQDIKTSINLFLAKFKKEGKKRIINGDSSILLRNIFNSNFNA